MDPRLENDTSATRVDLDKKESTTFIEFLYPDHRLFSNVESSSRRRITMDQILNAFEGKKWYGPSDSGKTKRPRKRWSPSSGCPSLQPDAITDREVHLGNFLNNVLGVVSDVSGLSFL